MNQTTWGKVIENHYLFFRRPCVGGACFFSHLLSQSVNLSLKRVYGAAKQKGLEVTLPVIKNRFRTF